MKKLVFGIGMLLLLAMVMPAVAVPAVVQKDIPCGLWDTDANYIAGTGHIVMTSSGNANLVCTAQLDPLVNTFPEKAVKWDFESTGGGLCGCGLGLTEDWQGVVTPSGQVSLSCHYKTA
jgi:hypothetical protein